jgi:flavin reductase (DIM6/NTAB) family NADH-FMN oxidoreductase RutF
MNPADVAAVLAALDPEVWLVTARAGERQGALIATSVSTASIVPAAPRVLVGIAPGQHTWELIEASGVFALHLLDEGQTDWVWHFGLRSGHQVDKLAGWPTRLAATGCPIVSGTLSWLDCRVEATLEAGERVIYLAEVSDGRAERTGAPLRLKRLLQTAPPERLRALKEKMEADIPARAEALRRWRQGRPR